MLGTMRAMIQESALHLLLVEDDDMLATAIVAGLRQVGIDADRATDAISARLALVDHAYHMVLLDLGLPGGSGLSVLRALRQSYDATPVLIVTARDALSDRIQGLDAGADDYIVKPFQMAELLARMRAVQRRALGRVSPVLSHGDVILDPERRVVRRAGEVVSMSTHEYLTLLALMERAGRVVSRERLEAAVYGTEVDLSSNTIAVYVHQLRRKLGESIVTTVHGQGYRLGAAQERT
jgi:two-component system, OmpR family, response regulator